MYTLVTYAETYVDREHIKEHIVRGCVLKWLYRKKAQGEECRYRILDTFELTPEQAKLLRGE